MGVLSRLRRIFFPSAPSRRCDATGEHDIGKACRNLRDTKDPRWLSRIFPVFAHADRANEGELAECARAVAGFIASRNGDTAELEDCFADEWANWGVDWTKTSFDAFEKAVCDEDVFAVLAAGTFHPSGYCRQRCLRRLERFGAKSLPYALRLANNWVQAIRDDAHDISLRLVRSASTEDILEALPALDRVRRGGRRNDGFWRELFLEARNSLRRGGVPSPDRARRIAPEHRRLLYAILEGESVQDRGEQLRLLDVETDAGNRLALARTFLAGDNAAPEMLERCLKDPFTKIRLLALERLSRLPGFDGTPPEELLFDPGRPVREFVRFLLKKRGWSDFAALYRGRVRTSPSVGAVSGLGETGDAADASLVVPLVEAKSPRLAKAAITALGNLDGKEYAELFHRHLFNPVTGKSAFMAMRRHAIPFSCRRYYEDYLSCDGKKIKQRLLALIFAARGWEKLSYLVRLYPDADHTLRRTLTPMLGCVAPTDSQVREVRAALEETPPLPKGMRETILFFLPKT